MPIAGIPCPRCSGQMLFYIGIDVPSLTCVQCGEERYLKRAPARLVTTRQLADSDAEPLRESA